MTRQLSVASICRILPNPGDPSAGFFVWQRLQAMARIARLTVLQPVPHFPLVRPLPGWAQSPGHDANGLPVRHVPMFYLPGIMKSLDGYWLYRAMLKTLGGLKRTGNLDCVDAHFGYPDGVGSLLVARKIGAPVVVTLRGLEADYLEKPAIGRQLRFMLEQADGCICVSHFLQDLALRHGASPDRVTVVHNAIDRDLFHPGDQAASRRKCGLPEGIPVIVSVGHLIAGKRHHVLIDAFAEFLRRHADARLLIVGGPAYEPEYPDQLRRQIERLGISAAVDLVGKTPVDQVAELLRAADIFALATRREGCCNAVLEALACGLPVVTTPAGDNRYFVRDGENGFIVPIDDAAALAQGLLAAQGHGGFSRQRIAARLEVGSWTDVALQAMTFIAERVAASQGGEAAAVAGG